MRRIASLFVAIAMTACAERGHDQTPRSEISAQDLQSGYAFLTADTQQLQDDSFENPGYLWVDRGARLFEEATDASPACVSCHQEGLAGVAARYPAIDEKTGELFNLEARINQCRTEHQSQDAFEYESEALLSLTAYVAEQSRGVPQTVAIDDQSRPYLDRGEAYFLTRRGQFNLSCQQCHTENWGKQLRGDTISQGHSNGFPAYRLEWQSLGSLQRRLRDCDTGVRAEPLPYGDPTYIALELYLAARGNGLDLESPAVRR